MILAKESIFWTVWGGDCSKMQSDSRINQE